MQELTIIGRLGKNAQVHETKNGKQFVSFTVAVNSKRGADTRTTWYEVISFNEQHVGKLVQYLTKGSLIVVVGELDAEAQLGKDGKAYMRLTIVADKLDFVSTGTQNQNGESTSSVAEKLSVTMSAPEPVVSVTPEPVVSTTKTVSLPVAEDDDLPF